MASFYGLNATLLAAGKKAAVGDGNGHTKNMADKYTGAQAVYAVGDLIYMGIFIPKGAKVKGVHVISASLGTTGIFTVGYAATEAGTAESAAALCAAQDAGGQAVASYTPVLADALTEAKQVILKFTEATDVGTSKVIKVNVEYVVD